MSWLDALRVGCRSARANGMRLPPMTAARRGRRDWATGAPSSAGVGVADDDVPIRTVAGTWSTCYRRRTVSTPIDGRSTRWDEHRQRRRRGARRRDPARHPPARRRGRHGRHRRRGRHVQDRLLPPLHRPHRPVCRGVRARRRADPARPGQAAGAAGGDPTSSRGRLPAPADRRRHRRLPRAWSRRTPRSTASSSTRPCSTGRPAATRQDRSPATSPTQMSLRRSPRPSRPRGPRHRTPPRLGRRAGRHGARRRRPVARRPRRDEPAPSSPSTSPTWPGAGSPPPGPTRPTDPSEHRRGATHDHPRHCPPEALDGRWAAIRERGPRRPRRRSGSPRRAEPARPARRTAPGSPTRSRRSPATGHPPRGFPKAMGGSGDLGGSVTAFEMLGPRRPVAAWSRPGVHWGLFGGAVANLGTERHHTAYLPSIIDATLPGLLRDDRDRPRLRRAVAAAPPRPTTRPPTSSSSTRPTRAARKDYIGGAARDGRMAAVFAQLVTGGESHGVHCVLVPIRDEAGAAAARRDDRRLRRQGRAAAASTTAGSPSTTCACRATNLLNRYGDIDEHGTYTSPIENQTRRFFTMLGTLVRGRDQRRRRRRRGHPHRAHPRRRRMPGTAASSRLPAAADEVIAARLPGAPAQAAARARDVLRAAVRPERAGRRACTTCRPAATPPTSTTSASSRPGPPASRRVDDAARDRDDPGVPRGLRRRRLPGGQPARRAQGRHRRLHDVRGRQHGAAAARRQGRCSPTTATTFGDLDTLGMVRFGARQVAGAVIERTSARGPHPAAHRRRARAATRGRTCSTAAGSCDLLRGPREAPARDAWRGGCARPATPGADAFDVFNDAQDHVIAAARAHVDRVVLEAFVAGDRRRATTRSRPGAARPGLRPLRALPRIEADKGWFLEHGAHHPGAQQAGHGRGQRRSARQLRPHAQDARRRVRHPDEWLGTELVEPLTDAG